MRTALNAEKLTAGYRQRAVIEEADIDIQKGKVTAVIGCNGSGKSTLLRTLSARLAPVSGTVYLDGKSIALYPSDERAKKLSLLLTERSSPEHMTCEEAVSAGRYPYTGRLGTLTDNDREIVRQAMKRTGTEYLADTYLTQISDGQRQLISFAAAIAQQPEILLLDEPTSYLDLGNKLRMMQLIRELAAEGTAIVMTLHELYLAQRFSDECICTHNGRLVYSGTPEEIFTAQRINEIFGVNSGTFIPEYGSAEVIVSGTPRVFVIGGGGSGLPVYRELWRRNIPFAAGVLHENDIEYPTASALACEVITEKAFEPVTAASTALAAEVMDRCSAVICCISDFGSMNMRNKELAEYAEKNNKLKEITDHDLTAE